MKFKVTQTNFFLSLKEFNKKESPLGFLFYIEKVKYFKVSKIVYRIWEHGGTKSFRLKIDLNSVWANWENWNSVE